MLMDTYTIPNSLYEYIAGVLIEHGLYTRNPYRGTIEYTEDDKFYEVSLYGTIIIDRPQSSVVSRDPAAQSAASLSDLSIHSVAITLVVGDDWDNAYDLSADFSESTLKSCIEDLLD